MVWYLKNYFLKMARFCRTIWGSWKKRNADHSALELLVLCALVIWGVFL